MRVENYPTIIIILFDQLVIVACFTVRRGSHLGLRECDCDGAVILITIIIIIIIISILIIVFFKKMLKSRAQFIRPIICFISHLISADSNNRCLSPISSLSQPASKAGPGHLGGI